MKIFRNKNNILYKKYIYIKNFLLNLLKLYFKAYLFNIKISKH